MCVIIVAPQGQEIEWDILQNAVERNPDGWGLTATRDGGVITVSKGFGFSGAKKAWKKVRGLPRVFHARIGTSGTKDINNCHPFDASSATERRWFFHNGTVSIPRFVDSMCDSWHLAQYIRTWETDDKLHNAIASYAQGQNSRFVMVSPTGIHRYGKAWFQRGGVYYSNSSALAGVSKSNGSYWYTDGYLADKTVEVTSDTSYSGLHWDDEKKLYTNLKEAPSYAPNRYSARRGWGPEDWQRWANTNEESEWPRTTGSSYAKRRDDVAPWFNLDWGTVGSMRSYPSIDDFNYGQEDHHLQLCSTHRRKAANQGQWMETIFDGTGKWQSTSPVDGPYPEGLIITSGDKFVYYKGFELEMDGWKQLVGEMFDMKEQEDDEALNEQYARFMAGETDDLYEQEELRMEKGTVTIEVNADGQEVVTVQ